VRALKKNSQAWLDGQEKTNSVDRTKAKEFSSPWFWVGTKRMEREWGRLEKRMKEGMFPYEK
jgi:hypothetical protein